MIASSTEGLILLKMSGAEARALLNELYDVPGGSRLPKIKQLYRELDGLFAMQLRAKDPPQVGRPKLVRLKSVKE